MLRLVTCSLGLALVACTPLRPLDAESDAGTARARDASLDAAGLDAAGLDATVADAFALDAAGLDAPGLDAFVLVVPDAFMLPVDAARSADANCVVTGPEMCGGGDEDCDGLVDEPGALGELTLYADLDRDEYGDTTTSMMACRPPDGTTRWVSRGGDCNDTDGRVHPGRLEDCNAVDDDCDGAVDDGDPCAACTTVARGTHTYLFCDDRAPWDNAASRCMGWGYHLVQIEDAEENAFVTMTALSLGIDEAGTPLTQTICAIGLRRTAGVPPTLEWPDGTSPTTYAPWDVANGEPNSSGDCVRIRTPAGLWADYPCSTARSYVCETP